MKSSRFFTLVAAAFVAFFVGCSSPGSRIKSNQAAFDALPAEAQEKIRAGKVDVGFTPEMVVMALGEPDRRYTRTTERGESEIWAYRESKPGLSLGFGMSSGSGRSGVGTGVGIGTGGGRDEDKIRVIFEGGKVTATESSRR